MTYGAIALAEQAIRVSLLPDQTAAQVALKQHDYNELKKQIQPLRELANAWCAAFVIPKVKSGPLEPRVEITHDIFRQMRENPHKTPWGTRQEIEKLAEQYQFFHWHLAFPEVFQQGGFDCVLGNPPWERVKIQEKEWFAERVPSIATASNAAVRGMMIKSLATDNPSLFAEFGRDLRTAEGASSYMRTSGRYPLCGRGDVNLYTVFAEQMRACLAEKGRVGCIVPSGVSTDDTTKFFFQDLIDSRKLVSFYSFENEEFLFPGVHHSTKFCLLTATAIEQTQSSTDFVFFARSLAQLAEPNRHFTLTANDIKLLNPNTRTCPIFRSKADAELNKAIYRRVPVLIEEGPPEQNPWGVSFLRMLDMANDSGLFRDQEQLEAEGWRLQGNQFVRGDAVYLPLYEAKMVHYFDHRFGTYEGQTEAQSNQGKLPEFDAQQHADPQCFVIPRYWLDSTFVIHKTQDRYKSKWFFFLRDICRNTDSRTAIGSLVSFSAIAGGNVVLCENFASPLHVLTACMSSFAFDYCVRQKVGGTHLSQNYLKQLPLSPPCFFNSLATWHVNIIKDWLLPRVLELTYTAWDLEPFSQDCHYNGPPFVWDVERRFNIRAELDAAFFHLYLPADADGQWQPVDNEKADDLARLKESFPTPRDAVDYIMDTFPIVRRKDEAKYDGDYRTKRVILEIYDAMQQAIRTGEPYETRLNPPSGPPADQLPSWPTGSPRPATWPSHIHPPRGNIDSKRGGE